MGGAKGKSGQNNKCKFHLCAAGWFVHSHSQTSLPILHPEIKTTYQSLAKYKKATKQCSEGQPEWPQGSTASFVGTIKQRENPQCSLHQYTNSESYLFQISSMRGLKRKKANKFSCSHLSC